MKPPLVKLNKILSIRVDNETYYEITKISNWRIKIRTQYFPYLIKQNKNLKIIEIKYFLYIIEKFFQ